MDSLSFLQRKQLHQHLRYHMNTLVSTASDHFVLFASLWRIRCITSAILPFWPNIGSAFFRGASCVLLLLNHRKLPGTSQKGWAKTPSEVRTTKYSFLSTPFVQQKDNICAGNFQESCGKLDKCWTYLIFEVLPSCQKMQKPGQALHNCTKGTCADTSMGDHRTKECWPSDHCTGVIQKSLQWV